MLMVIVAMAIFAGIIIPQIGAAVEDAKESTLLSDLHEMTSAIERYRLEHNGRPPDDLTGSTLAQLTSRTNIRGVIGSSDSFPLGPYIFEVPTNPYNNSSKVARTLTAPPLSFKTASGWLYHVESGQIWPADKSSVSMMSMSELTP